LRKGNPVLADVDFSLFRVPFKDHFHGLIPFFDFAAVRFAGNVSTRVFAHYRPGAAVLQE
ncbi:MAG TPA: hypothetical protein PLM07_09310, partial [Candidatus Rifleibacterium sp.]|nr:hypothetical protein [Candidatus Rifleibacterium sp.]